MDHAKEDTFLASKLHWGIDNDEQKHIESLFKTVLEARADDRLKEPDPQYTQYKGWDKSERVFSIRRRDRAGRELIALFNLGSDAVDFHISADGVNASGIGRGYIVTIDDTCQEEEWAGIGSYSHWLDTYARRFGGSSTTEDVAFKIVGAYVAYIQGPNPSLFYPSYRTNNAQPHCGIYLS